MDETNIGAVISELRKRRGLTQERLAEMVGVSPPAVSKWETGASCPDVALLAPIARALDTDVNALLSFTPALSREALMAAVKEAAKLAESDGPAAMDRILTLTRWYPTDTQLRFQLSGMAMGLPQLYGWPEKTREAAMDFAEEGFEYVRQNGEKQLWPTATYLLAALLMERDKLDRAEALGYPPCLMNIQLAARAMERGEGEEALEKLALVARELKGETARSQPLWGRDAPPDPSYYSTLARMLQSDLNRDPGFETLRGDTRFQELLRQLDPEA